MKATVVEIQSKHYRIISKPNPFRLVTLQFNLPLVEGGPTMLRIPENHLGIVGLCLDDEIEVTFNVDRIEPLGITEDVEER
jgi:hypothetical protein